MRSCLFAAAICFSLSATAAHADTVTTYELGNTAGKDGSGTVTIDSTLGSVTALDASFSVGGTTYTFEGVPSEEGPNLFLNEYQATLTDAGNALIFGITGDSLVGYTPTDSKKCATAAEYCDYLVNVYSGTPSSTDLVDTFEGNLVVPPATGVTPEPSSIALLGTGLLAVAGFVRRRRV